MLVIAVGEDQAVKAALQTIKHYTPPATPIVYIHIKNNDQLSKAFSIRATLLIVLGYGTPEGLVLPQNILPWQSLASLVNSSPTPLHCIAACHSANMPTVNKPTIRLAGQADARIVGLYVSLVIAKLTGQRAAETKILMEALTPTTKQLLIHPQLPLKQDSWTKVKKTVWGGDWLKVIGELYQQNNEADPNNDYYLLKITLMDEQWASHPTINPYTTTVWAGIAGGDRNSVIDYMPPAGFTYSQVTVSYHGISISLPRGYISYIDYEDGAYWTSR